MIRGKRSRGERFRLEEVKEIQSGVVRGKRIRGKRFRRERFSGKSARSERFKEERLRGKSQRRNSEGRGSERFFFRFLTETFVSVSD